MHLQIENLTKALAGRAVLQEVSLKLELGRIACLLGASGCGKTTLLRCVAGFETVDSGSIQFDGHTIASDKEHRAPHDRSIGMVFQDHALFPHLTIAQNAAFGLHKWSKAEKKNRAEEVLSLVGLADKSDRFPHQLSGGQQQRAALARALASRPKLLLLDEPFASLDRDLRYRLVQDVSDILRATETTALWVTHDPREALQAAYHVGVMQDGAIGQWDTPQNLYQRPVSLPIAMALGDCSVIEGTLLSDRVADTLLGPINVESRHPLKVGQQVQVLVRPEQVAISTKLASAEQATNEAASGTLKQVWYHGQNSLCSIAMSDGSEIKASMASMPAKIGTGLQVSWVAQSTVAFLP